MNMTTAAPKYRPLTFGVTRVRVREGAQGVQYVKAGRLGRKVGRGVYEYSEGA